MFPAWLYCITFHVLLFFSDHCAFVCKVCHIFTGIYINIWTKVLLSLFSDFNSISVITKPVFITLTLLTVKLLSVSVPLKWDLGHAVQKSGRRSVFISCHVTLIHSMLYTPSTELHFCAVLLCRMCRLSEISKPLKVKWVCSSRTQHKDRALHWLTPK